MTGAVGVLCARMRIEEKQLVMALATAGVPALPLPPSAAPLPILPPGPPPGPAAPSVSSIAMVADGVAARLIVDRCQDRATAAAVLPVWRALGVPTLDAGLAATGNRLQIAAALAAAGVARPATQLVCSEAAALLGLETTGYPATLLPLTQGGREVALLDRDVAEAVLEHRDVLGGEGAIVSLLQAGAPGPRQRALVIVVDGQATAVRDAHRALPDLREAAALAEAAGRALGAGLVGIELAVDGLAIVVWDIQAAPDFRDAFPLTDRSVAEAIVARMMSDAREDRLLVGAGASRALRQGDWRELGQGVGDDVVLTA